MNETVAVITKRSFVSDQDVKDVLTILEGVDPIRLGEAGCEFSLFKRPSNREIQIARKLKVDINFVPRSNREKQIVVADMDGTIINQESLDELADLFGIKQEFANLTSKGMQGQIPFDISLRKRVKLLQGISVKILEDCMESRISLCSGASVFMQTMNSRNAYTMIVSGGLKFFASRLAKRLNVMSFVSNDVEIKDGKLTGQLEEPLIDELRKFEAVKAICTKASIKLDNVLAVGDGANDIKMLQSVGLGVAYKGKKILKAATTFHLDYSDLTALLFLQGIVEKNFIKV